MAKEIKQKIVLDGEAEYKKALKESRTELSRLKGEMKAEAAEAERNATASEKAAKKQEALKKQIAEQEKIVKTLSKALEEAKSKYSDNAEVIAKWENQYNSARTTLANMKNELESVADGFKATQSGAAMGVVATKSFADALGSIGNAGEAVSNAIENIFKGMINTVETAVVKLWSMMQETAGKANGWADTAAFWGTDAATIQMWEHATAGKHNDFQTLMDVATRLTLGGKDKEVAEMLGISGNGYQDKWAFAVEAMNQLQELSRTDTEGYYDAMEAIFGQRRATNVMDLVNDWDGIKSLLPEFDAENGGLGLNNTQIDFMSGLMEKIDTIQQKWVALKDMFAEKLGTITVDTLVHVEGALDALGDYLNADDDAGREAAMAELKQNVEAFFTDLADAIRAGIEVLRQVGENLQGSDDPLTSAIGDILVSLTDSLQWLIDNQKAVKGAFEAIFGAWLLGKLAAVAGKLTSILEQIAVIKAFKGVELLGGAASAAGGVASAAGGAAVSAGGAALAGAGGAAAAGAGGAALAGAGGAAASAAGGAGAAAAGGVTAGTIATGAVMATPILLAIGQIATIIRDTAEGVQIGEEKREEYDAAAQALADTGGTVKDFWEEFWNVNTAQGDETQGGLGKKLMEGMAGMMGDADRSVWMDTLFPLLSESTQKALEDMYTTARDNNGGYDPESMVELQDTIRGELDKIMTGEAGGYSEQLRVTEAQRQAAEDFWDIYRSGQDFTDEDYERFENAFVGNESVFEKLDALITELAEAEDNENWRTTEDLPVSWYMDPTMWQSGADGKDLSGTLNGLPGQMAAAVLAGAKAGIGSVQVVLDGQTVGNLVAPYVSQYVSRDIVE